MGMEIITQYAPGGTVWSSVVTGPAWLIVRPLKTRKPCCRKETARCRWHW